MDKKRSEFLSKMVTILGRLGETSAKQGQPLLASVLAIAQKEAEDALRHLGDLDELERLRAERSSATTWRACDRPDELVEDEPIAA
jgi:hypothetical protein